MQPDEVVVKSAKKEAVRLLTEAHHTAGRVKGYALTAGQELDLDVARAVISGIMKSIDRELG